MTPGQARHQFSRVFTVFPSYRSYLESLDDGNATLDSWCQMLSGCDESDVEAVVDDIVSGVLEAVTRYQKPDQLPFNLRAEAADRRSKRTKRVEQEEKYHKPVRSRANDWVRNQRTGRIAVDLGERVRRGELSREENARRMDELLEWDKGRGTPSWIHEYGEGK